MSEWRLFNPDAGVPEQATAAWYENRERAPHLEQEVGMHRPRLLATHDLVMRMLNDDPTLRTVGDFGAGDGGLLSTLPPELTAWGYDLCPANVEAAQAERKVSVRLADFTAERGGRIRWPDLAVMTETLEHLEDPHGWLGRLADRARALVCSSPAEERAGFADPVHLWAWDMPGYFALVTNAGWRVTGHTRCGPYQLVTAVR